MEDIRNSFFYRIYYSIAGFRFYKFFPMQKTSRAVVYLLLLALITGAASLVYPILGFNSAIDELKQRYDTEIPDFTFSNSELKVEGPMPIIIDGGPTTLIIDTSDNLDESIIDNYDSVTLITKTQMIQKQYDKKQIQSFSMLPGLSADKASVKEMLPMLKWLSILIAFFGILSHIIAKFASVWVIALFGTIAARALGLNLTLRDVFVLSAYSVTLPLILCTALGFIPYSIPYLWIIFYVISGVYLLGALNVIKKEMFISRP
jgi:hypothetical protein